MYRRIWKQDVDLAGNRDCAKISRFCNTAATNGLLRYSLRFLCRQKGQRRYMSPTFRSKYDLFAGFSHCLWMFAWRDKTFLHRQTFASWIEYSINSPTWTNVIIENERRVTYEVRDDLARTVIKGHGERDGFVPSTVLLIHTKLVLSLLKWRLSETMIQPWKAPPFIDQHSTFHFITQTNLVACLAMAIWITISLLFPSPFFQNSPKESMLSTS